ncbi:MAG TPA: YdeI/OmpD-associated family protein [Candidatus Limnocylindrales bacterium]|nr:YdeI/OmpD-associated family protein [Candidatus Limnocylindrales bacterium]
MPDSVVGQDRELSPRLGFGNGEGRLARRLTRYAANSMGERLRFKSVIEQARGPGAAVGVIPADVATALGGLKQMRVTCSLNGVAFRSSTYPWHGRELYVGLPKATREAAGVGLGDTVELELARDDSPRVLELHPELDAALAAEPALRARFEALAFGRRRELAEPVAQAVKPETRAARIEKALARLRELSKSNP